MTEMDKPRVSDSAIVGFIVGLVVSWVLWGVLILASVYVVQFL